MATLNPEVSRVLEKFEAARSARKPLEERWMRAYKLYRSHVEDLPEEDSDLSNIFVPKTFSDIESIVPRMIMATIGRRPWVSVKPREKDDVNRARMASKLLQAQFDRQGMFMKLVNFYKQALIYGTSPGMVFWRKEERVTRQREFRDRLIGPINVTQMAGLPQVVEEVTTLITDWDDPWFEPLDLWDFFPDPDGKAIAEMGYIIRREWVSREDMEKAGVYDNIPEAARTASANSDTSDRPMEERLRAIGLTPGFGGAPRTRPILLLHLWTRDRLVVVANGSVIVRDTKNEGGFPFHHGRFPFVAIVDTPVPNEFWGIGTALATADLQEELNAWRNLRMDNAKLSVNRMFMASRNAGINPAHLRWRPGGIVWVDDLTDINKILKPIDMPDISRSSYMEEEQLHRDIEETNAVSDFVRGAAIQKATTATEISQMAVGANARVDMRIRMAAELGIKEIARHFLDLNRQFITTDRVVRYIGESRREEWVDVSPGDLQFPYDDLIPAVSNVESWANEIETRQDLLRLIQILGRAPEHITRRVKMDKVLERLLETFPFAEVEEFMKSDEELQQEMMMAMQQQMIMAQQQAGGLDPEEGQVGQPGDLMAGIQDGIRGTEG